MEGHIWIESEGVGKGCTANFIVKLGYSDSPNESKVAFMPKALANNSRTSFPGLKVLVMDDNGLVHHLFESKSSLVTEQSIYDLD